MLLGTRNLYFLSQCGHLANTSFIVCPPPCKIPHISPFAGRWGRNRRGDGHVSSTVRTLTTNTRHLHLRRSIDYLLLAQRNELHNCSVITTHCNLLHNCSVITTQCSPSSSARALATDGCDEYRQPRATLSRPVIASL